MPFREKRKAVKLSQVQAAEVLGVNNTTISMWEAGKSFPRASLLPKIAALYNCTIDELLKEEEATA